MESNSHSNGETLIAVIGCGNVNRSDDGVGSAVVAELRARATSGGNGVLLLDAGTDGMAVMFAARGCRSLIIVDACRSGAPAGAIFEVPGTEVAAPHSQSLTLHDFRWNHALFAGQKIFAKEFPGDVTVFLVEAASTDFGLSLSPAVAASLTAVVSRIEEIITSRIAMQLGAAQTITMRGGNIYLALETYEAFFGGLDAVALVRHNADLLMMPVKHAPAGGSLLKRRNAHGDRVVSAGDFLRQNGIVDESERRMQARWDSCSAALVLSGAFFEGPLPA